MFETADHAADLLNVNLKGIFFSDSVILTVIYTFLNCHQSSKRQIKGAKTL